MKREVTAAFANTRLSTLELQILSAHKRGFTLETIAEVLNLSQTSLRRTHVPSINHKLDAKISMKRRASRVDQACFR
ncbi:MAG: hypothetical protein CBHOC_4267 [uncultured Caballeronia sp.]|nr:MAG: hypothetical protein CBHOC_4267 [uncultured Caballeronia sp.]